MNSDEEDDFTQPERLSNYRKGEEILDMVNRKDESYKADPKIGRNDPCPCGSGKKYKKCCLNKVG